MNCNLPQPLRERSVSFMSVRMDQQSDLSIGRSNLWGLQRSLMEHVGSQRQVDVDDSSMMNMIMLLVVMIIL